MNRLQFSLFRLLAAGLFAIPMASVNGAYLESDPGNTAPPPAVVRPPTPWSSDNPLRILARQVDVGEAVGYRELTVFPLTLRRAAESGIATLDQTLAHDGLTIREQDEPNVATLRVRNTSSRPVLLMAGEILQGGRQNRIVREDVLLPADSSFVQVPVYCGEQRRWEGGKQEFKTSGGLAGHEVRGMAARAAPQADVWQAIDSQLLSARVEAPTRNVQTIYDDKEAQRAASEAVQNLMGVVGRETVGVMVISRGQVLSCDLFSDPELLAQLWPKICRAHAVDECLGRNRPLPEEIQWRPPDRGRAWSFLTDIAAARMTSQETPGAGETIVVSGAVEGRALVWREHVAHAALFPASPPIRPLPRMSSERREVMR